MKTRMLVMGSLLTGALVGGALAFMSMGEHAPASSPGTASGEPLYWVAPMDPAYRRDGPGKSPMGMDLVPVYADAAGEDAAGVVRIAPGVVNNLGVRTAVVQQQTLREEIRSVGYVRYDEDRLIHIHPRVEGWVEELFVKAAGDPVAAGQALYALYSPQLVNAQEELVLALRRGDAQMVAAAEDRLRALQLPDDVVARLKRDRTVQQTVLFNAPQAGVIDNLNIREGFFVGPDTTMMSIASLDQVWVEVEIFERQSGLVSVGQPVEMTLDYLPGRQWAGTVDYVYPSLDAQLRTLRVRLRFDNSERLLKPNMFAQVAIYAPPLTLLAVPGSAVIRVGEGARVVLALADGAFRSVPVHLGRTVGEYREVLHGLAAGDRVVTSAQFLLDSESNKQAAMDRMAPVMDAHDHHAPKPMDKPTDSPMNEHAGHQGMHHD